MSQTHDSGAIVLIAPNSMSFRAISNSSVLEQLQQSVESGIFSRIYVLSPNRDDQRVLPNYVEWRNSYAPGKCYQRLSFAQRLKRFISVRLSQWCGLGYANIAYRFNHLHGFYAHQFKRSMNVERRKREELAGNFVSTKFGFPFANSQWLYTLIYSFYYSTRQVSDPGINGFFNEVTISRLVFWHVQNEIYRDYSVCARRRGLPIVAVIGSWDRPTTKGPICPGCEKLVVNNQVMKQELIRYHGYTGDCIDVVGWPQMDRYFDLSLRKTKTEFFQQINVPTESTVLLFAGNTERLGAHEPGVVAYIAEQIIAGQYGSLVHLVIRPHPQDPRWSERYHQAAQLSCVTLMPAQMGELETMINSIVHADVIIATQGSITIDAAAFDKCIINIGFDGHLSRDFSESVKRWFQLDHYKPIIESGGVALPENFAALDAAIIEYLSGSDHYSNGRKALRKIELEPFDGKSSKRQIDAIIGNVV